MRGALDGGDPGPFRVVGAHAGGYFFRPAGSFFSGPPRLGSRPRAIGLPRGCPEGFMGWYGGCGRARCVCGAEMATAPGFTEGDLAAVPKRPLGIPLGWPRAVEFASGAGPASPPGPAEALRVPLGLG